MSFLAIKCAVDMIYSTRTHDQHAISTVGLVYVHVHIVDERLLVDAG